MLTEHGVKISPRTFYAWAARPLSKRALWDITITEILIPITIAAAIFHLRDLRG